MSNTQNGKKKDRDEIPSIFCRQNRPDVNMYIILLE